MQFAMPLSPLYWLLAFLPVLILLGSILFLRWEAAKAGAAAWLAALAVSVPLFGASPRLLALANCKGIGLSVFVLLIIWGAVFLYNVADKAGAITVIGKRLETVTDDALLRCLLFAWCFTSVLQGVAGFGVPVAVVAPLMIIMGYPPLTAVAACLVGHSWSISFGSMGSSYISIQLVTGVPGEIIGPVMALLFSIAVFSTGLAVAHIYGGMRAVVRAVPYVLPAGAAMSGTLWLANVIGVAQLASLLAAVSGCVVLGLLSMCKRSAPDQDAAQATEQCGAMSFHLGSSPYYLVVALSVIGQIPPIKAVLRSFYLGLDYPAMQTAMGYMVKAETAYSRIQLFSHPAPIMVVSALVGYALYVRAGCVDRSLLSRAAAETVKKCVPTSVGILLMVMMALVMIDSGMTFYIAQGIAGTMHSYYGFFAPAVGVLGSFITGSNTNSNIMFGALQYETAVVLGKSGVLFAAAQSLGGSVGVSISPSTVMMGASNTGLNGQESAIMRITVKYCLISAALAGLAVWIIS